MQCSFNEEINHANGTFTRSMCVQEAKILVTNDPCFGLCFACAYNKIKAKNKRMGEAIEFVQGKLAKWPNMAGYIEEMDRIIEGDGETMKLEERLGQTMKLEERLKSIIAEQFNIDIQEVTLDKNFADDFRADSLDSVELIMGLEDEFDIIIKDEEVESIKTVRDAFNFLKTQVEQK